MATVQTITPCLWFDDQAEEAATLYVSLFDDSRIVSVSRYGEVGKEAHGREPGSAMTVAFELAGQSFVALNGGPAFQFNEAVSFQVNCETQAEVDYFWEKLSEEGDEQAQQCGWLKDRFGLSWQVVPSVVGELLSDPDVEASQRAMAAMLQMKKIDIETMRRAFDGQPVA